MKIADHHVGPGHPCFVIAEIAQAHDGSLGTAHAFIDVAARCGADAIKFQTHIAAAESTPGEPFRVKFSRQDASRYDYWQRMEFTEEQWHGLAEHAAEAGLVFLSSAFSMEAVSLLERVGMPAWKVGSGEVTNLPFLERLAATGKPILLSSGMSSFAELDSATQAIRQAGGSFALFQCTTSYPCPPEKLGLNVLPQLRRFGAPVGLSDHSATIYAGLAAATLGADLLEVHLTMTRDAFGPDVTSSLTPDQLTDLVEGVRFIERALAHPVDKDALSESMGDLKTMFGKSLVAARDLPAGHTLTNDDIGLKKPATGIPAARFREVLGRTLKTACAHDHRFTENDFE